MALLAPALCLQPSVRLRQHLICCRMLLSDVISFKLWPPDADSGQRTTSSPSPPPASPAHGGPHCSGSSATRQPPSGEGTSHCNLGLASLMQQGIQWCPGETKQPPLGSCLSFLQQVACGHLMQYLQCSTHLLFSS